jgi:hypothetical protein
MARRWAILGWMLLVVSACGGNVVVDHGGAGGAGAGGSGSGNGSQGGGDVCEKAVRFVEKCANAATGGGAPTGACTGAVECQSNCINATTCGALTGSDPASAAQFDSCLMACGI